MHVLKLFEEYIVTVDEIYGIYLDSSLGFRSNFNQIHGAQQNSIRDFKLTQEYIDKAPMLYGIGDPNFPNSFILHECTQDEFKKRNSENGKNIQTLANLCIIQVYQYWEDYYRGKIAEELGLEKNELKSEIFRDLNLYRKSIIHHRGIALDEIDKCKIFRWFKSGNIINLDKNQVGGIILGVKTEIQNYKTQYCK